VAGASVVELNGLHTVAIRTTFDQGGSDHEAQAAIGDSGGAAFVQNGSQWELAGILFAIGDFPDQPFEKALYGNLTFSADLSFYRQEILDEMALPEPSGALWPGGVAVALLARRRGAGSGQRFAIASTRS